MSLNMTELTDQELREKLTSLGVDVGPIVDTTRKLYLNKLARLLNPEAELNVSQASASQQSGMSESSGNHSASGDEGASSVHDEDQHVEEIRERRNVRHQERYREERQSDQYTSPSLDSTIHLIRPRKRISEFAREAAEGSSTRAQARSPFPAADAQFRKPSTDENSVMHHVMKFGCFAVVMIVIVFFILNSNPGTQVDIHSKSS